jgi:hypothetical protein
VVGYIADNNISAIQMPHSYKAMASVLIREVVSFEGENLVIF